MPRTVRIKFTKTGSQKYISHLDLQRTFTRAIIRSGIPVWYTKGFNPHSKLVFSAPLPIGCESLCEFVDIRIERDVNDEEIKEALSQQFTDEMLILEVFSPKTKFQDIAYISYKAVFTTAKATEALANEITKTFTTSPFTVMKHTKSGDKEIDIIPLIASFKCEHADNKLVFTFTVGDGSGQILNPELIMRAACDRFSLIVNELCDVYSLVRTGIYRSDMSDFE